jgi:membrane protein implicated in regulation of membrane protease activity
MQPESVRALMWSGAILIILGAAVGAPAGGLFCMGLAALCALAPIIVGPLGPRIGGAVILAVALAIAAQLYPLYQKELERAHERATKSQSLVQPQPAPPSSP